MKRNNNLSNYIGVRYLWGGENSLGIDCSGLPRKSYRKALFTYGIAHLNSEALRLSLSHWWYDSSALAMSESYRNYLSPLHQKGTINNLEIENLQRGDLAITVDGVHVIVYLKDHLWIQADPFNEAVIITDSKKESNSWFDDEVRIYRWQNFSTE